MDFYTFGIFCKIIFVGNWHRQNFVLHDQVSSLCWPTWQTKKSDCCSMGLKVQTSLPHIAVWSSPNLIPLWRKRGSKVHPMMPEWTASFDCLDFSRREGDGGWEDQNGGRSVNLLSKWLVNNYWDLKLKPHFYEVSDVLDTNLRLSYILVCIWHVTCDIR